MALKKCLSFFVLIILLGSCSKKTFSGLSAYQFASPTGAPNYSDLHYWAAHPDKWDPSDSVPKSLRSSEKPDQQVDVFFVYPTTFTDVNDTSFNARIDDKELNAKTDYSSLLYQASVFNADCRVFAPRYRQAHYRAFSTIDTKRAGEAFDLAYADVAAAFKFYLTHYNNGRPIIIAAHSQGTLHAAHLLKEFFDGKKLQPKLVAAYIIGLPVTESSFTVIRACKDSSSTGCIISWRTYEKGFEGEPYIAREKLKAINVNPLTMQQNETYAPAEKNIGGMLRNFNKLKPSLVDAQVHENILWVSKPKFFGSIFLRIKNYHIADYNLFYSNIRADVHRRIGLYWKH